MRKWLKRLGYTILILFILLNIVCASQAYHFIHFYDGITLKKPGEMGIADIVFGVDYPKAIVVDSLKSPHTNVEITTEDNLKLAGWRLTHAAGSQKSRGTVIMFHGHGSSRSGVINEADNFYNLGWNVLMIDFRAHGKSEGNLTSIGYFEAKDVKAAYDFIAKQGEKNIVLWGISLGAATITKAISDYTTVQPAKVILEMPFATMLDATEGRVRMEGMPAEPISALVTFWGGVELGLWAFSNKPQEYARKINCPVLLQKGRLDIRVTDAEEQTLFNNIPAAQKKYVVYETAAHESLCKKEPEKWLQNVSSFLNN